MDNKTFALAWFREVWNNKSEAAIHKMFSKTGIAHGISDEKGNEVVGPEQFSTFFNKFIESFPDIRVKVEDTVSEGDKVVSRCTVSFTHSGSAFRAGSDNTVDPSGKKIEFSGMSLVILRDGQIQEAWNNFDFLSMYMQMGVVSL